MKSATLIVLLTFSINLFAQNDASVLKKCEATAKQQAEILATKLAKDPINYVKSRVEADRSIILSSPETGTVYQYFVMVESGKKGEYSSDLEYSVLLAWPSCKKIAAFASWF